MFRNLLVAALATLLQIAPVSAHHAFAVDYSEDLTGSIEGTVVEVLYQNPHARYYVEVENDDGTSEMWDVQTMNVMALRRLGWVEDTVRIGDEVSIYGNLGRDNTKRMNILTLEEQDGTVWRPMGRTAFNERVTGLETVPSGRYEQDPNHAYVSFSYSHFGLSNPTLRFNQLDATVILDSAEIRNSRVDVAIDASSIDSAIPQLDQELIGEMFFDVANHPTITFTSTDIELTTPDSGRIAGDLLIKGVSQPVTLDIQINDAGENPMSLDATLGISATGQLSRTAFGLGAMAPMIGDEVRFEVQLEMIRQDEQ